MENMNTTVSATHMEHPEDPVILEKLKNYESEMEDGYLKLDSGRVFVVEGSDQDKKLNRSISDKEGKAFALGTIEVNDIRFAEYNVNETFFKS